MVGFVQLATTLHLFFTSEFVSHRLKHNHYISLFPKHKQLTRKKLLLPGSLKNCIQAGFTSYFFGLLQVLQALFFIW